MSGILLAGKVKMLPQWVAKDEQLHRGTVIFSPENDSTHLKKFRDILIAGG